MEPILKTFWQIMNDKIEPMQAVNDAVKEIRETDLSGKLKFILLIALVNKTAMFMQQQSLK